MIHMVDCDPTSTVQTLYPESSRTGVACRELTSPADVDSLPFFRRKRGDYLLKIFMFAIQVLLYRHQN